MHDVDRFTNDYGLTEHNAAFRKGAILAQSPQAYDSLPELTNEDRDVINREHTNRWSQCVSFA